MLHGDAGSAFVLVTLLAVPLHYRQQPAAVLEANLRGLVLSWRLMLGSTNSDYVFDPWTSVVTGVKYAVCMILQYWLDLWGMPGGMLPSMTQQNFLPPHISVGGDIQASPLLAALRECDTALQELLSKQQQQQEEKQHREVGLSTCAEVVSAACAAAEAVYLLLCIKVAQGSKHQQDGQGM
jgi:hypothetical protein